MNSSASVPNAFLAIFWGGFACGVFDITQAFIAWGFMGIKPVMILHHIASGLLGPKANQGGGATAALGLALHFVIAFGAATVYYVASRWLPFMTEHAVISGLLSMAKQSFCSCTSSWCRSRRQGRVTSQWLPSLPAQSATCFL